MSTWSPIDLKDLVNFAAKEGSVHLPGTLSTFNRSSQDVAAYIYKDLSKQLRALGSSSSNSVFNNIGTYGLPSGGQVDALNEWWNSKTGAGLTEAEKEANAFTAQQSMLGFQRDIYADSTKHQREVADLAAAGINPMMAGVTSGGSISAPVGSSVSPGPTASFPSFNLGSLLSSVAEISKLKAEKENIEADTALKKQEATKRGTETEGIQLDNEFKRKVMDAKVEGEKLANSLTRGKINDLNSQIDNRAHDSFLKSRQAQTEEERQKYFETASILNRANAYKVTVMIPYEQALASAKTEAEKATAGLAMVNAAYQQGLIDNGYIDNLCSKVASEAGIAEDSKEIMDIKKNIRIGNWSGDPVSKFLAKNILTPLANILDNYNPLGDALSGLSR